ncbi:hypothetical protein P4279_30180 [Bacillus thuringiensis]|nr:hypothetical protein [Bacillus cereus]MED2760465.1 hypothetical protein [Bacillus thuringiensis]MED2789225.1 hypothetical protein [Bacillus thuringiensis]MED2828953.1 hypothetical protein [Bacillus thuringiensis]MED2856431.1 hypothetical protein [Bacillus thuringiensis]
MNLWIILGGVIATLNQLSALIKNNVVTYYKAKEERAAPTKKTAQINHRKRETSPIPKIITHSY